MTTSRQPTDDLLRAAVRAAKVGLWDWDIPANRVTFSTEWKRLVGHTDAEITDAFSEWETRVHPDDLPRMKQMIADYLAQPWCDYQAEFRLRHKDGGWRWFLARADLSHDECGRPQHMIGSQIDITDQKRDEIALARANRALRMLSDSNQALIRTTAEDALLREVCRIVVDVGGYRMAWVGRAERDTGRTVRPLAFAGVEQGYLAATVTTWDAAVDGRGPVATAIAAGKPCIVRDIPGAASFGSRREAARQRGYRSCVALPLLAEGGTLGVLEIYATDADAFDPAEIAILGELAGDLAFGIATLRMRAERDRATEVLRTTERQLRTLLENFPDFLCRFDLQGRFVYVSPSVGRATGVAPEAILGRTPFELGICVDRASDVRLQESFARVAAKGLPEQLEVSFQTPDGPRPYQVRHTPEKDERGAITSVLGIATDLSERKAAERQLYLLNYALDQVGEGIFLMEGDTPRFGYVNRSASASLGYSREELTGGMDVLDVDPEWSAERWAAQLPVIKRRKQMTFETSHRSRDGHTFPVEVTANYFHYQGRAYNMAIVRDVTERKRSEAALRAREREYRTLAENTPDEIIRWDRELRRVYVNPAFAAAVGMPAWQIIGTRLGSQYSPSLTAVNAPSINALAQMVQAVFDSGQPREALLPWVGVHGSRVVEHRLVPEFGADGQVATVLGIGRDITKLRESERQLRSLTDHSPDVIVRFDAEGRYLYANSALEQVTGVPVEEHIGKLLGEVAGRGAEGAPAPAYLALRQRLTEVAASSQAAELEVELPVAGRPRIFNIRLIPEPEEAGIPTSVLLVARDVTERRGLEEQLRQSQKMEAVGQLAGGIAHDFNNMLAVIQMQSNLLLETARAEVQDGIPLILAATARAANLTRQLLTFSRRQVVQPVDLDISDVIGSMTMLLRRVLGEDIALETRFAPGLPFINADPGMMEQVLMNLGINARDAMPEGGRLIVALDVVAIGAERSALHPGAAAGRHICLSVSDTGCGIAAADLPRIFEPFFTTKEIGKGTGLGLATVFGIVQQHNGWIEVDSTVGQGATFRVLLPALHGTGVSSPIEAPSPAVRGGHETILLVEDEPAVRTIMRSTLERLGYRVLEADAALAALKVWDAQGRAVDLLLTDLVMPGGVSGRQLGRRLLEKQPRLKVIYMSGYSPDVVSRLVQLDPGRTLLQKPFAMADLAVAVRRCLDE